jgi:hypothetical protein
LTHRDSHDGERRGAIDDARELQPRSFDRHSKGASLLVLVRIVIDLISINVEIAVFNVEIIVFNVEIIVAILVPFIFFGRVGVVDILVDGAVHTVIGTTEPNSVLGHQNAPRQEQEGTG